MRPRPERRGETGRSAVKSTLGAGYWKAGGFNAATTRRPWRTHCDDRAARPGRTLQCGHSPKAVENAPNVSGSSRPCFNAATTRRPWRTSVASESISTACRRFNAATTRRPWRTTLMQQNVHRRRWRASMRPRPEGRGERGRDCGRTASVNWRLQCGHSPKAVENRSRCKRCISRWLERAVRAGGVTDGHGKQRVQGVIQQLLPATDVRRRERLACQENNASPQLSKTSAAETVRTRLQHLGVRSIDAR